MARRSQVHSSPSAGRPKPQGNSKTAAVPQGRGRPRVRQSIEKSQKTSPTIAEEVVAALLPSPPQGESQLPTLSTIAAAVTAGLEKGRQVWREATPFDYQVTDGELAALPRSPLVRPSPPPEGVMSPLALTPQQQDDLDVFAPGDDLPEPAFRKIPGPVTGENESAAPQPRTYSTSIEPAAPSVTNPEVLRLRNSVRRMSHTLETASARASRLETRNQVYAALHDHHVSELAVVRRERRQAEFDAERERGRKLLWTVCIVLALAVLGFLGWCCYNRADFEYIRERRDEMFGFRRESNGAAGD